MLAACVCVHVSKCIATQLSNHPDQQAEVQIDQCSRCARYLWVSSTAFKAASSCVY